MHKMKNVNKHVCTNIQHIARTLWWLQLINCVESILAVLIPVQLTVVPKATPTAWLLSIIEHLCSTAVNCISIFD